MKTPQFSFQVSRQAQQRRQVDERGPQTADSCLQVRRGSHDGKQKCPLSVPGGLIYLFLLVEGTL